jgi:cutinase
MCLRKHPACRQIRCAATTLLASASVVVLLRLNIDPRNVPRRSIASAYPRRMGIDAACLRRITTALCGAILTFGLFLVAPIGIPTAAAQCPAIEVSFARGTSDPPGPGKVGQAFIDSLRGKVGGRDVGQYAINYAASMNFLLAADGVSDGVNHVNYMVANCPETRLVLGGFSQGAAVVDVLTGVSVPGLSGSPLPPEAADHIT